MCRYTVRGLGVSSVPASDFSDFFPRLFTSLPRVIVIQLYGTFLDDRRPHNIITVRRGSSPKELQPNRSLEPKSPSPSSSQANEDGILEGDVQ